MIFDNHKVKIDIQLENGIYLADNNSAIGKTFLCKELKKQHDSTVIAYTYEDYVAGVPFNPSESTRLIMLDRYDRYEGAFRDSLISHMGTAIILVVSNRLYSFTNEDEFFYIDLAPNSIKVYN